MTERRLWTRVSIFILLLDGLAFPRLRDFIVRGDRFQPDSTRLPWNPDIEFCRYAMMSMSNPSAKRPRVLFINSALLAGADTGIHLLLLRNLPHEQFELYAAAQPGPAGSVFEEIGTYRGVSLRATDFGPSLWQRSKIQKLAGIAAMLPAAASLIGLAAFIRANRIDILHSTDRPRDAIACALLSILTGAKSLIHAHVNYGNWMSRGVRWALGRADAIVGVSNHTARTFLDAGYQPDRVHAILNAIDPSHWDPTLDPAAGRASLSVPEGAPLIVSISRLFRWKGHSELLSALAIVKRHHANVQLAIVGADYPKGSHTTQMLRDQARKLDISENVIFTGQRSDIASILAACDIFALPSLEEPFGLVFAEAMAMKRPVVALDSGGTPEVVKNGKCGLLSPVADIDGLARNLLRLLDDSTLRAQFGANGRLRVDAYFTPQRLAADFSELYARMLT